jgi:peptidoglycan hydrolase CwlO-like protein
MVMTDQYKNTNSSPKIVPNIKDNGNKDLIKQVKELKEKIHDQDQEIHRMHRDIVRLRESINQVAARIKS